MDDKYLDSILQELSERKITPDYDEVKELTHLKGDHFFSAMEFLKQKGYAKSWEDKGYPARIGITPNGKKFLSDGGFTHEQKLRNAPLNANLIAKVAIGISIIAIIISIIALITQPHG